MRKKNEAMRFARWCFSTLEIRPIPIQMMNYKRLIDPNDQYCFGCYAFGDGNPAEEGRIYIAYGLPKYAVLTNIAHEIWHHCQNVKGRIHSMGLEECEEEAHEMGNKLLALWLMRGGYMPLEVERNG